MALHVHPEIQQGTEAWHDQRRGMVTASVVGALVSVGPPSASAVDCPTCQATAGNPCVSAAKKIPTPIKTFHDTRTSKAASLPPVYGVADNDTSRGLTATLVAERLTGHTEPSFMNDDMARGVMHEPLARDRYAEVNEVDVKQVGFLIRDDWGYRIGASPDGLIGDDGGLEVKCPRAKTHIRTIIADEVPPHHLAQVHACMVVSGREWWDFVSFCAGLPLWTKRVYADPKWHAAIVGATAAFEEAAERLTSDYLTRAASLPTTDAADVNSLGLVF